MTGLTPVRKMRSKLPELLEKVPVEPVGVGDGVIYFLALFVQNHVGGVVVFVDYQV